MRKERHPTHPASRGTRGSAASSDPAEQRGRLDLGCDHRVVTLVTVRAVAPERWQEYRDLRLAALTLDPDAFASTLTREAGFTSAQWRERCTNPHSFIGYLAVDRSPSPVCFPATGLAANLLVCGRHPQLAVTGLPKQSAVPRSRRLRSPDRRPLFSWSRAAPIQLAACTDDSGL